MIIIEILGLIDPILMHILFFTIMISFTCLHFLVCCYYLSIIVSMFMAE